ncbi:uncharacterized protein LOC135481907 [Liolophura sinensis]|uniref:uncharacterized protein LOC135481907 n=1 Tax=Liolophura sinensis TaxID=3198878 RepID=UPI0031596868
MWDDIDSEESGDIMLRSTDQNFPVVCSKHQAVNITTYLLKISEASIPPESKLAALSFLNQMFEQDSHQIVRFAAIEQNVLPVLLELLDDFILPTDKSDKNGSFHCRTLSLLLCQTSLKLFWHLSQLPICQQYALITEPVIRRLMAFLDPSLPQIYQFPSAMFKRLRTYTQGKTLFAQIRRKTLNTSVINLINEQADRHSCKLFSHRMSLADTIYSCILYDTSDPDEDVNIGEALIGDNLAWLNLIDFSSDVLEESEIHVLQVVGGHIFWAHVGEMNQYVKTMQDLHNKMISLSESVTLVTSPDIGDHVMVRKRPERSTTESYFYRARIVDVRGDNFEVFAIDMGVVLSSVSTSSLYHLPQEVCVQDQPPLASLCMLHGVQAPAKFPQLPQLAIASLVNLCRYSVPAGEIFAKTLSGVPLLCALLRYPDRRVSVQAIQLLNNLACNTSVQKNLEPSKTVPVVMDILVDCMTSNVDEVRQSQVESCLVTLSTLLTLAKSYREIFYQYDGLTVVLRLLSSSPSQTVYQFVVRLLRIFLRDVPLNSCGSRKDRMARILGDRGFEIEGEVKPLRRRSNPVRSRSRSLSRGDTRSSLRRNYLICIIGIFREPVRVMTKLRVTCFWKQRVHLSNKGGVCTSSPHYDCSAMPVLRAEPVKFEPGEGLWEPDHEKLAVIMSLGTTQDQARLALQAGDDDLDKASEWVLENVEWLTQQREDASTADSVSKSSPAIFPVDATLEYVGSDRYYVVDSPVDYEQDAENELQTSMSIAHASTEIISQIVCGFLNCGRDGRIVFGVRPDGRVHGVSVNREERDQFRLGVDRMMVDKLTPLVIYSMYEIVYCPVVRPQGHADPLTRKLLKDVFVVEILLKCSPGTVYTLRNGMLYYRLGPKTVHLNTQEMRQMVEMEEEAKCKAEVRKLQKDLETLRRLVKEKEQ